MDTSIEHQHGGARILGTGEHRGHAVEIAAGYDGRSDQWHVHIYIDGRKEHGVGITAGTADEAIAAGEKQVVEIIDSRSRGGFQQQVR